METPRVSEEEAGILFQQVLDPLLKVIASYVNKMSTGEVPVDLHDWFKVREVLYGAFEIPAGTLPDDPTELKEPLMFGSPFDHPTKNQVN